MHYAAHNIFTKKMHDLIIVKHFFSFYIIFSVFNQPFFFINDRIVVCFFWIDYDIFHALFFCGLSLFS